MNKKPSIMNRFINIPKDKEKYEPDEKSLKLLSDKWKIKILKNIGFGGFSLVKLVYSENTNKYYACKIVIKNIYNIYNKINNINFCLYRLVLKMKNLVQNQKNK